ncbi:CotS family spore coat protein [Microaerobacter geothermalis]|uniref:CotS family spore coat protein n=1 Tax=Microaerobacter geothermalis TaxID=674972 RepID=UPI001F223171|nr:CotS family spore coat protein [Microaerobacter geothermalis]MCF6093322.1 CotS family spore coat protein [Microaerobacter geothermalis]
MNNHLLEEGKKVFEHFPYNMKHIRVIQGEGSRKILWKVSTNQGDIALKRSHYPLEKLLFSIYGQMYVLDKGARVPRVLKSKKNIPYVQVGERVYTAYNWFRNSRNPNFQNKLEFRETIRGLALFHKTSEGYVPPVQCEEKWRLGKGIRSYQSLYQDVGAMVEEVKGLSEECKKAVGNYLPSSLRILEVAIKKLEEVGYDKLLKKAREKRNLTHEDFGEPNALMVGNKGYVIDLDGMAYNLPIRELQKMIIKGFRKHGINENLFKEIVSYYEQENPLSTELKKVMVIEMMIPSHLFRVLRTMIGKGESVSPRTLEKIIQFEKQKQNVLENIRY